MKKLNKIFGLCLSICFVIFPIFAFGCENNSKNLVLKNYAIEHELEFGGVYVKISIEDFNKLGFKYGDSVNVRFSNSENVYEISDIPYYNGYYTQNGEKLLVGYKSYPYIKVAINNGEDLWDVAELGSQGERSTFGQTLLDESLLLWSVGGLQEDMTATITLKERGKYLNIQKARDIEYKDERALYPSDEVFANFRALRGGSLKENKFFRSASPCDNQRSRAGYVDRLIEGAGVSFVIDLADTTEKIEGYMAQDGFDARSPYFKGLYQASKVMSVGLNMNYSSADFKNKVANILKAIAGSTTDETYLVHCTEGKDRTGFVCLLIEMFAGATYKEIYEDYMMTYFNYYAITKAFDEERYTTIKEEALNPMLKTILGQADAEFEDDDTFVDATENYLSSVMTSAQITALREKICE